MRCAGALINAMMDYSGTIEGMMGCFPNFEEGIEENQQVFMVHLIKSGMAEYSGQIPGDEIGNPDRTDVPAMFRAANRYAQRHGYIAGIPNLHHDGGANVYGMIFFKEGTVDIQDVKVSDLKEYVPGDDGSRFRAVFRYKNAKEMPYSAAFPNFEEQNHNGNHVFGVVFLKNEVVEARMIPSSVINLPTYEQRFCTDKTGAVKQAIQNKLIKLAKGNEGSVKVEELEIKGTHVRAKVKVRHKHVINILGAEKIQYSITTPVTLDTDVSKPQPKDIKICVNAPLPNVPDICLDGEDILQLIEILATILVA
ncbi:hypothetical protein SAMN04488573_1021283 [Bacillus sp. 5mfcol3.1]|uniref:hypothetical protein n=1 Tax=Bacillus sp. 5mfcol3.1 TaxID=1761756 RepID=UPI0008E381AA|nr:hypothetical protein [Bacillus sp. 5mfcol3.1]SFL30533.1 hypothetical protein SAMN04488573_1021283 [Bacillus sp. 5mfcol3.1]